MWRVNLFIFTVSEKIETSVRSNSSKSHIKSHLKHLITEFLSYPQLIHIFRSSNLYSESTAFKLTSPPSLTPPFSNKHPISLTSLSGATKGIGRAIALNLATRGAAVLGTYSDPSSAQHFDTLSHTVSALYSDAFPSFPPKLVGIAANILSPDCADLIARTLETEFDSHVDILVNNAAIMVRHKIGEIELGDVEKSLLGNVQTPVLIVETLVRKKLFRPNARIVNISSDGVRAGRVGGYVWLSSLLLLGPLPRV